MTRQEANLKILELIKQQINSYPDLRFNQILTNLSINTTFKIPIQTEFGILSEDTFVEKNVITDRYNEEPSVTLERIKKSQK